MQTLSGPPLIETKLRRPDPRPGLVPRADLVARLDAAVAAHRLTVVSAAAGWGKTTLVGDWLGTIDLPTAWVALDASDNDPARFWRYLSEALARAGVALDVQAVGALSGADETREVGLSELINAIADAPGRTVIALDDYHVDHRAGHPRVDRLPRAADARHAPAGDRPRAPTPRSASGGCARAATSRRSAPTTCASRTARRPGCSATRSARTSPPAEVERLRARTEGWAAGLYLAGLSLRGREDAAGFIDDFAGDDRLVVDYLAAEVLEGQSPERRRFLLRTSILGAPHGAPLRRGRRHQRLGAGARRARAVEPLPGAARQPARVVPLPPPLRRAAAPRADRQRAGRGRRAAPPRGRLAPRRRARSTRPSSTPPPRATWTARPT